MRYKEEGTCNETRYGQNTADDSAGVCQEVCKRLPRLGVDDQHRRDLVAEKETRHTSVAMAGLVTELVFAWLVAFGQVALVLGHRVLVCA